MIFGFDIKSTGNKSKNRQMGLYRTKNLHHTGNGQQNEKEKVFANLICDKQLI